jgi:hypothetical protein
MFSSVFRAIKKNSLVYLLWEYIYMVDKLKENMLCKCKIKYNYNCESENHLKHAALANNTL